MNHVFLCLGNKRKPVLRTGFPLGMEVIYV